MKKPINLALFLPILFWSSISIIQKYYLGEIIISYIPQLTVVISFYILFLGIIFLYTKKRILSISLFIVNVIFCVSIFFQVVNVYEKEFDILESPNTLLSINLYYYNQNYSVIIETIDQTNPDILILIEYSFDHNENIGSYLRSKYNYVSNTESIDGQNIIFSKYPITSSQYVELSNGFPGFILSDIKINDEIYQIYAVHSAAPIKQNYFESRNLYLQELSQRISTENDNFIIAGDLNITPWSRYYQSFKKDIFLPTENTTTEKGILTTWNITDFDFLGVHIDHIIVSEQIPANFLQPVEFQGSDHKGLLIEFE